MIKKVVKPPFLFIILYHEYFNHALKMENRGNLVFFFSCEGKIFIRVLYI